jgi:hypothetical protein
MLMAWPKNDNKIKGSCSLFFATEQMRNFLHSGFSGLRTFTLLTNGFNLLVRLLGMLGILDPLHLHHLVK